MDSRADGDRRGDAALLARELGDASALGVTHALKLPKALELVALVPFKLTGGGVHAGERGAERERLNVGDALDVSVAEGEADDVLAAEALRDADCELDAVSVSDPVEDAAVEGDTVIVALTDADSDAVLLLLCEGDSEDDGDV